MDVIQMDMLIEKQMMALNENIIKQEEVIRHLESVKESYKNNIDTLDNEGHQRVDEIVKSFKVDQKISRSIVDEIESISSEVQRKLVKIEEEKEKASGYINSLDAEVELYLKRIEDSNKLEIDDLAEGIQKVKGNMVEIHDKLNQLVEERFSEIGKELTTYKNEQEAMSSKLDKVDQNHLNTTKYLKEQIQLLKIDHEKTKEDLKKSLDIIHENEKNAKKMKLYWVISTVILLGGLILVGVVF